MGDKLFFLLLILFGVWIAEIVLRPLIAQEMQNRIKKWSEQYPNVICYCFDSFSTLLYVL